jgi:cyclophilin family peptidyl-prolyl cis-trans isomerase
MVVEKRGTITIELLPNDAPKTVAHFLDLVKKKFYDGILFHRYVKDFVVQGGDPKSKKVDGAKIADIPAEQVATEYGLGDGGSGTTVPLEAKASHDRGTVGLARSSDPNSGDSQFFFNLQPNLRLDGGYCVFGRVVDKKSLAVMDKIRQGDKITSIRLVEEKPKGK